MTKNDRIKVLTNKYEYARSREERLMQEVAGLREMTDAMGAILYSIAEAYGAETIKDGEMVGWELRFKRPDVARVTGSSVTFDRDVLDEWRVLVHKCREEAAADGD